MSIDDLDITPPINISDQAWDQLRHAQLDLIQEGYAFDVQPTQHTVYKYDKALFGLRKITKNNQDDALYCHWSAAISTAHAHHRISMARVAVPVMDVQ